MKRYIVETVEGTEIIEADYCNWEPGGLSFSTSDPKYGCVLFRVLAPHQWKSMTIERPNVD